MLCVTWLSLGLRHLNHPLPLTLMEFKGPFIIYCGNHDCFSPLPVIGSPQNKQTWTGHKNLLVVMTHWLTMMLFLALQCPTIIKLATKFWVLIIYVFSFLIDIKFSAYLGWDSLKFKYWISTFWGSTNQNKC